MLFFEMDSKCNEGAYSNLIAFIGQSEGDASDYSALISTELARFCIPYNIIFIYPEYLADSLSSVFQSDAFNESMERVKKSNKYFYSFDKYSHLFCDESLSFSGEVGLDIDSSQIINAGIHYLAKRKKDSLIVQSPPGTVFVKPSGDVYEEFIRTSEILGNYSEQQFMAYSLLFHLPKDIETRRIYVDTPSISSVVESIIYYLYRFSGHAHRNIRFYSFESYSGIERYKPNFPDDVWVLISASTSNSMADTIIDEWKLKEEQVVTVLSYVNESRKYKSKSLINISSLSNAGKVIKETRHKVRLVGDNFTAEIKKPRLVVIKKSSAPDNINDLVKFSHDKGMLFCNKKPSGSNGVKPLSLEINSVGDVDGLKDWISTVIKWHVPPGLACIAYNQNDSNDQVLLEVVKEELAENGVSNFDVCDIKDTAEKLKNDDQAILVLTSVISSGRSLLNLNRSLRICGHKGNRIFVAPFIFGDSSKSNVNLRNSLVYGPNGFKYQLHSFREYALSGLSGRTSWDQEKYMISKFKSKYWVERVEKLNQVSSGLINNIGLSPEGKCELDFSKDFAFWDWKYEEDTVSHAAVYLTVSLILQKMREASSNHLKPHIYEQALLDPDNFVRFNDGLLQSCLWRLATCNPPEN